MQPLFFETPADFRRWLERHHQSEKELLVGFHRKGSGRPSITWPESVDQALCFGWIDGVRRGIDDESYSIRFTPRKARSTWSSVNIARVQELEAQGLMQPAGAAAFAARTESRSSIYAYENELRTLSDDDEATFRKNEKAWSFFSVQAPSYRRVVIYWVTNAKKDETRQRRLKTLIDASENGRRIR
jgi:uncharacterized protein YdeI (YjbR/CyaY-like superfamily)